MSHDGGILGRVQAAAAQRILFLPHAIRAMARSTPMISRSEMECLHCKGLLVKGTAPFSIDGRGYHLHWDAVPAWVCTQCGEPLFEGTQVDVIQETIKALDKENEKLLTAS